MNLKYISLNNDLLFNWYESLIEKSISRLEGKKLDNGKLDFYKQEFFKQYFTHFISIKTLSPGLKLMLKGNEHEISALASILILLRACLENYSMFYYVYRNSICLEEKEFRFWSWYRESLMNRQRLTSKNHKEKKENEKALIDDITNGMKSNKYFQCLSLNQQKRYLKKGKWYFIGKRELLNLSGFSEPLSADCYNFFSSYTHPTSSSHLQTSQASYEGSSQIKDSMLKSLFISSGLFLNNYATEFKELADVMNDKDKEFILSWCELGGELMK
jgi:hypothetical protein